MKLYQISRRKVGDEASSSAYVGRINQNREDYNEDSDSDDKEEDSKNKVPQRLIENRACKVCKTIFACYDNKIRICDECVAIYFDYYDKEDNARKDIKSTTISSIHHNKQQYTYNSILGSEILSQFDEPTQQLMAITKDTRTTSSKDLNKARESIVVLLQCFDGKIEQAPKFYYNY